MSTPRVCRVGFVGLGTVGQGTWEFLEKEGPSLNARLGVELVPWKAAVRDAGKARDCGARAEQLTGDPLALARDPQVDILCEVMGGTGLAREVTLAALQAGKHVVTANKALLCDHGAELFAAAEAAGGRLYFEASVAGGIPVIKALQEGLVANRFELIFGILNGTCNYILTRMEREQQGFEAIVADARALGYVEADEALDLDGLDAAHKAVILAYLAHGHWVPLADVALKGIRDVSLEDLAWARQLGYRIKLLAVIHRDTAHNTLSVSVQPTLVPLDATLARVNGVLNAVSLQGDWAGESVLIGRGAGRRPTASSVVADLVDAARDLQGACQPLEAPAPTPGLRLARAEEIVNPFYVRVRVQDAPGVLAEVSGVLARASISLASVLQRPAESAGGGQEGEAQLVLTTHRCSAEQMQGALRALESSSGLLEQPLVLPIADFTGGD